MSYNYQKERPFVFTDEGQRMLLKIRDNAARLFRLTGCATLEKIIAGNSGDSWSMLACADRLVEIGEIRKASIEGVTQHDIYVPVGTWWTAS